MMFKFINEEPWNKAIGILMLTAILIGIAKLVSPWVIAALLLWVAFLIVKFWVLRTIQLKRNGYFGGSRTGDLWVYEERQGNRIVSLSLKVANTEPGHWELFFPDEREWRVLAPQWALDRRTEIAHRIAERWNPSDFHLEKEQPFDLQAYLAQLETEGWTLIRNPDGTTTTIPPAPKGFFQRFIAWIFA